MINNDNINVNQKDEDENDLNIISSILRELEELKQTSFILNYNIKAKNFSSINFDLITIESNEYSVNFSTYTGAYQVSPVTELSQEFLCESFEQMLRKISEGYSNKFFSKLFKGLEDLSDQQNNENHDNEMD